MVGCSPPSWRPSLSPARRAAKNSQAATALQLIFHRTGGERLTVLERHQRRKIRRRTAAGLLADDNFIEGTGALALGADGSLTPPAAAPEPASLLCFGFGLDGLDWIRRSRRG
jgi:hypothetical protein